MTSRSSKTARRGKSRDRQALTRLQDAVRRTGATGGTTLGTLQSDVDSLDTRVTDVEAKASTTDIYWNHTGVPLSSEILYKYVASRSLQIPDDFTGSVGHIEVNPTASFAIDVTVNGSSVGTITIDTAGLFTFVTAGTTVLLTAGDVVRFVAPGVVDATADNISITIGALK